MLLTTMAKKIFLKYNNHKKTSRVVPSPFFFFLNGISISSSRFLTFYSVFNRRIAPVYNFYMIGGGRLALVSASWRWSCPFLFPRPLFNISAPKTVGTISNGQTTILTVYIGLVRWSQFLKRFETLK